jgi:thymidylate synthase (FAD)
MTASGKLLIGEKKVKVRLVSHTQSEDGKNLLEQVAYAARVSNPSNQGNNDTAEKLVDYLIKNKHWSPLEMVSVCLEIETTRDIARQMLRHRSFSFQEFSQRYADPTKDLDFQVREARLQDPTNRQNSISENVDMMVQAGWDQIQRGVIEKSKEAYKWAIENGIAKEVARVVLPEGLTVSRLYMTGTLRSWLHYIEIRSGNGTQKEHAEIARTCANIIAEVFPATLDFIQE